MVGKPEPDPFEMSGFDLTLIPRPTREIMFALLGTDKRAAMTPRDILKQCEKLRSLAGKIEFAVSQWDREKQSYWEALAQVEKLIQWNNAAVQEIRRDAAQASRDQRREQETKRIESIRFGVERMPVNNGTKPSYREDHFSGEGTKWRQR